MLSAESNVKYVKSPYIPRPQFMDFHSRDKLYSILVCHRRMGKTVACVNDLIDKAMQCQLTMPRYGYVAPFYSQAKAIAWNYLKYFAAPFIAKVMESELSVVLVNGALIKLHGADNPDSLRGVYWDGVILDEYGDMAPRLFGEVIQPSLVDRDGWCVFIGTAKGPNHFYDLWKRACGGEDADDWFTQMSRASETGIIAPEKLEKIRTMPGTDEDTFRQEYECDFHAAIKGSFYGKLINEIEAAGHMKKIRFDPDLPVITAWDIGYTDDTSIWFVQMGANGEIGVIDFFSESGWSVDDIVDMLKDKPYTYGQFLLPHDAKNKSFQTGKSTIEILWGHGIKVNLVPSMSRQDGIAAVRKTLPKVYFDTTNPEIKIGVDALRMYQREYDDKRKVFKANPLHDWSSNPADAFRMLCLGLNPRAEKKGGKRIATKKTGPESNVMCLDQLYKDRDAKRIAPSTRRV